MGMHLVYVVNENDFRDGDRLGSAVGWDNWSQWVLGMADYYPECAHLAEEGDLEPAVALAELEHELEQLAHEPGTADERSVAARLLSTLQQRPEGTVAILVSDGEAGAGVGEDDDAA